LETKTCPHCNELADREYAYDISFSNLEAYVCSDCSRTFFVYSDLEEGVDI
jgi:transposase-like protein